MDASERRALLAGFAGAVAGVPRDADWDPLDRRAAYGIAEATVRRYWRRILTVEAPRITCDALEIIALADGRLIVDQDVLDGTLAPFADTAEKELKPPYRITAARIEGDVWGLGVAPVVLLDLPRVEGDTCDISRVGDVVSMTLDDVEVKAPPAAWDALRAFDGDVALTAEWLEDETWVASVWPL